MTNWSDPASLFGDAFHRQLYYESVTAPEVLIQLFKGKVLACRGDKQVIEGLAGEGAGGSVGRRHTNGVQHLAVTRVPAMDAEAAPVRHPQHPFFVDGHSIRIANAVWYLYGDFFEFYLPRGCVIQVGFNAPARAVD